MDTLNNSDLLNVKSPIQNYCGQNFLNRDFARQSHLLPLGFEPKSFIWGISFITGVGFYPNYHFPQIYCLWPLMGPFSRYCFGHWQSLQPKSFPSIMSEFLNDIFLEYYIRIYKVSFCLWSMTRPLSSWCLDLISAQFSSCEQNVFCQPRHEGRSNEFLLACRFEDY